jgi:Replication initiator protein A
MKDKGTQAVQDRARGGRDELNLTEFPIALLSDRPSKKNPSTLRFEAGDKVWEIAGHPDHGLPTAGDVAVYVCLMELTREQEYPVRVRFTRHDLLQRLGWSRGAHEYARLQLALDRLVGVTITTTNAYYDARDRKWLRRHAFHVLEEYKITDVRQAARVSAPLEGRADGGGWDEPDSWFRWSEAIGRNLQAGYIKTLNVPLFLSLKSSISQTLYRYLDAKVRDGKTLFRQGLRDLAYQHLGLSRDYYPSQIKRKLEPAHDELIGAGFLTRAEYARMRDGDEMVVYHFPRRQTADGRRQLTPERTAEEATVSHDQPRPDAVGLIGLATDDRRPLAANRTADAPRLAPPSAIAEPGARAAGGSTVYRLPSTDLLHCLLEVGITRGAAEQLVRSRPEVVETQLQYWPYRETKSNPAGALRLAIEEDWPPPARWREARKQEEQAARTRQRRQKEQARAEQAAAAEAAFDAWWAALPEPARAAHHAQAEAELIGDNPILAQYYQRNPDSLPKALRPILMRRMG